MCLTCFCWTLKLYVRSAACEGAGLRSAGGAGASQGCAVKDVLKVLVMVLLADVLEMELFVVLIVILA